ncbi:ABC transporter substrate-binding protein [Bradyrhizobium sp. ARR65]|uniref:ABC transporter substrate-binding protein n=1 Tax=Bradyrhizobium sp. ARR65 TaxID=1040989 RepID=UPI0018DC6DA5|nr:ABC transporter substrate-binding protein [Bradyrhizobium sp. ARR65]
MIATFLKGSSEAGYIQGQSVTFEYAWADHHYERLPMLVSELVERQVKVILAASTPSALAAKLATSTIPIVFAIGGDPVGTGLVGSLSRPDSNVTGAAHRNVDTAPKRLELLHELLPGGTSFGLLTNPNNTLTASVERAVRTAAEVLSVQLMALHASTEQELEATLRLAANGLVTGLVIGTDSLFRGAFPSSARDRFN